MNLTSFLANKCFEYFLKCDADHETGRSSEGITESSQSSPQIQFPVQPPWSIKGEKFQSLCDGCGECVSACENKILSLNKRGYPQVDFTSGSCSFCGVCAESCPKNAFKFDPSIPPWDIHARINSRCIIKNNVICRSCAEQCDKQAIIIPRIIDKNSPPRILTGACNGCGACYKVCPVQAIEMRQTDQQEQS